MEAQLAELLKRATAAFAAHGDSQFFFVVHKVDDENRVIDHREWPVTAHSSQSLSLWAIELLRLPRRFGAYIKSVWYCNGMFQKRAGNYEQGVIYYTNGR
jgi:hypothetical protein